MSKPSFYKYVIRKINEEYTILSKILLTIIILSSFIPIPEADTATATTIQKLIAVYDSVNVVLMIGLLLTLGLWYLHFANNLTKLYLVLIISPIISITIYNLFGIITPIQMAVCLPTIIMFVIYIIDWLPKDVDIDTTKFKKIFLKK